MIAIDSEFQSLIPPLSEDEYERLEKSILSEGVRNPIITWNGTIIDGHNRYNVCEEHGIECPQVEKQFPSREAAKIWIIENQFGRRNLSPYDRSVLALKLEPLYTAEAERRHAANGGDHGNQYTGGKVADVQNSALPPDKGKTRDKVAAAAGVSHDTIRKVKVIETEAAKGNETAIEARAAIKSGEKSINKAYTEIRPKICTICGKPIQEGDAYEHDANKHRACANRYHDLHRARNVGKYADDGRRICTVCGEPIDEGDAYDSRPSMHKSCWNMRSSQHRYANPDISLLNNVAIYTVDSLLMELQASADNLKEAWSESIIINESMGVELTKTQKKKLDRAVVNLFRTIQRIKEGSDND